MLGPSITGAVTPFAFGYALSARTRGSTRWLGNTALAITALEVLLVAVFVIGALIDMTRAPAG